MASKSRGPRTSVRRRSTASRNAPQITLPKTLEAKHIKLFRETAKSVNKTIEEIIIPGLPSIYKSETDKRQDAADIDAVTSLIGEAESEYSLQVSGNEVQINAFIEDQNDSIEAANKREWNRQITAEVKAIPNVPDSVANLIIRGEEGISKAVQNSWMKDQFDLIKVGKTKSGIPAIPDGAYADVKRIVQNGIRKGTSIDVIIADLREGADLTLRRARLIAEDQTLSHMANMTNIRHENIGVTEYIWRTAGDLKVRESHKRRNGKTYPYNRPKFPSSDSIDGPPGTPIRCRCTAQAVLGSALKNLLGEAA